MIEIYFESYGCTANHNSTEIMKGLVKQSGFDITTNLENSQIVVINSCIVKDSTKNKIRRRIQDLIKQNKKVILAGCMPRLFKKKLKEENLFLLEISQLKQLPSLIADVLNNKKCFQKYLEEKKEVKLNLSKISKEKYIGITQISEGCLGDCSYCIVKLAKGKLFSYPEDEILKSIKADLSSGCKEIQITSQDCASYGNEFGEYRLPSLLKEIVKLDGNFMLRIGMMNPNNVIKILPELIEIYKDPKIFKFLHLPIQSGSDKVLKDMNRKYKISQVTKIIKSFQKEIHDITISTDIIVGYPTETEKDWKDTLDFVNGIKPEILNRSNFSLHKETSSAKLKKLPTKIINKRAKELQEIHLQICSKLQEKYLGKTLKVLIDKKGWNKTYLGRTENYKLVAVHSEEDICGKKINVKINKINPHYLIGENI